MKKIALLSLLAFTLIMTHSGTIYAATGDPEAADIAPQPCDTKFWNQMSSRAWLEAEREIMQNQNLIFKPDSVLDYTCFEKFLGVANQPGGDIFVHTKYFVKQPIKRKAEGSMDKSLTDVVQSSFQQYQTSNFPHEFLGGRGKHMDMKPSKRAEVQAEVGGGTYGCSNMAVVWQAAKCANFVDNSEFELTDGFYPFDEMKGHNGGKTVKGYKEINDTRKFYKGCGGPASTGANKQGSPGPYAKAEQNAGGGDWETQIKSAENQEQVNYQFQTPLNEIFKDVGEKLKPGACGKEGIPTGVMVYIDNKESHMDGACTNPGCTYTKGSKEKAGKCS